MYHKTLQNIKSQKLQRVLKRCKRKKKVKYYKTYDKKSYDVKIATKLQNN